MTSFFNKLEGKFKYTGVIIFLGLCISILLILLATLFITPRPSSRRTSYSNLTICDLNGDGKCGWKDKRIFNYSMGKCKEDKYYLYDGDYDGDGCISNYDKEIFLNAF